MPASDCRRFNRRTFVAVSAGGAATAFHSHADRILAQATPVPEGWLAGPALPSPRSEFPATVLDGMIYVAGGFGTEQSFTRFDPETGEWKELAPLPQPRHHLGLAATNNAVYIAGGHDSANTATNTFWKYDPTNDQWSDGPVLPQGPRGALGFAALDGLLYAVGGSSHDLSGPATGDVAVFDPAAGSWQLLESMPTAREHLSVASANGLILAIGGRNGGIDISAKLGGATEAFDPVTGTWETRMALPVSRSGMGVANDGEQVIVLGGEGERGAYADVNRYDSVNDSWSTLPDLPGGRHGVAAAMVNGTLYAIGGSTLAWNVQNIFGVDMLKLSSSDSDH